MRTESLLRYCVLTLAIAGLLAGARVMRGQDQRFRDPAAWGSDHVGKPVPEYTTGDECLFCHRNEIGTTWPTNRHNLELRKAEPESPAMADLRKLPALQDSASKVSLLLGGKRFLRFAKPSQDYGKLELLSVVWKPDVSGKSGKLISPDNPLWDARTFADQCAGCHATAVDPKTRAFANTSLDCFTCHGDVPPEHAKDTKFAYLAKKKHDSAQVITSICAQCHIRTGKSKSTGLPYPNNFVAGDNLFRDFQVDFTSEGLARLNPADRHVLENVRDVVVLGKEDVTCLSCHDVHKQSTKKHRQMLEDASCQHCHNPTGSKKVHKSYEVHSTTCQY